MLTYLATLTQTGENPPVATEALNQIGDINYGYLSDGIFNVIGTGLFPLGTCVFIDPSKNGDTAHGFQVSAKRVNDNLIRIFTGPGPDNGVLLDNSFKIEVPE